MTQTHAAFHVAAIVMSRWGGQKASDARPRDLSKKQKKRKRNALVMKAKSTDKAKEKLSSNYLNEEMKTPNFQKSLTDQNPE